MKSALAEAAKCQVAYISRVLNGLAHLSLEQADAVSTYLHHSDEERHFFLLQLQYARAGSQSLEGYFQKQLEAVQKKRLNLKERFQVKNELSEADRAVYYSSWLYAAVHMCLTVPALRSSDAIARELGAPLSKIVQILEFFENSGIATREGGRYRVGTTRVHLGNDSPLVSKHHMNWRVQAMRSLDREDQSGANEDLHYSSVISVSRADRRKLKELLVRAIDEYNAVVAPSPEEEVHCLTMDFFKV